MATKVHMEALSPTMEEGQLVKWHKSEGEEVSSGDLLAEVETDKATMELVARGDGLLRRILLSEGGVAEVGAVIAVIATAEEDIDTIVGVAEAAEASESKPPATGAPGGPGGDAPAPSGPPLDVPRVKASPLARRLAGEAGLPLSALTGSGPGGRIVKRDVEAVVEVASATAPVRLETEEGYDEIPLSQMRKAIARRLAESLSPVPHFFLTVEVDMSRVGAARAHANALLAKTGEKISVNDYVLKAAAAALRRHPAINAAWHDDHIRRFWNVHLGVAVAVEDGLITPVLKHADRKGLAQISREVGELARRARERNLSPNEYTGATFSVSNLGMFGIQEFTAIINPPEAGILAIGRTEDRPVVEDGKVTVRPRMRVTMSCDHRVVDGAMGARFLQTLQEMLEEPAAILI